MVVFQLDVKDQKISISKYAKQIITTNSVNFFECLLNFDGVWNNDDTPLTKTIIFYQSPQHKYEVLVEGNRCVIPGEVLLNNSIPLYVGMVGVSSDPYIVVTTNIIQLPLVCGMSRDNTQTPALTPTMYDQLLSEFTAMYEEIIGIESKCIQQKQGEDLNNIVGVEEFKIYQCVSGYDKGEDITIIDIFDREQQRFEKGYFYEYEGNFTYLMIQVQPLDQFPDNFVELVASSYLGPGGVPPEEYPGKIVQVQEIDSYTDVYIGYFYQSTLVNGEYVWQQLNVQPGGSGGTVDQTYKPNSTNAQAGTAVAQAVGPCATKVANATSGHLAGLDASGNLTDSGKSAGDFAEKAAVSTAGYLAVIKNDGNYGSSSRTVYDFVNGFTEDVVPDASNNPGRIIQCFGGDLNYHKGYFYQSVPIDGNYVWQQIDVQPGGGGSGAVDSVNGKTGVVVLTPSDLGLVEFTAAEIDTIWNGVFS